MPRQYTPRVACVCQRCGCNFTATPSQVAKRRGRFCSAKCRDTRPPLPPLELTEDGATALVPLRTRDGSIRAYAFIDAADAEWVNQWPWALDAQGYAMRTEYLGGGRSTKRSRAFRLHRELMGLVHGDARDVDHIDRDRLNYRRENLRVIPHQGRPNGQNRKSHAGSSSTHRGVYWHKSNHRWAAQIQVNGRKMHLGCFDSELEAAEAARAARLRLMPYALD